MKKQKKHSQYFNLTKKLGKINTTKTNLFILHTNHALQSFQQDSSKFKQLKTFTWT